MGAYEPSLRPKSLVRSDMTAGSPPANVLAGLRPGDRCPRPHCGGLLLQRAVVTEDGSCEEVVCAACARSLLLVILEPYAPMPSDCNPALDRFLRPDPCPNAGQGTDGIEDSDVPPAIREAVGLDRGLLDESSLTPPLDPH